MDQILFTFEHSASEDYSNGHYTDLRKWKEELQHPFFILDGYNRMLKPLNTENVSKEVKYLAIVGALFKTRETITTSHIGKTFMSLCHELEAITKDNCHACPSSEQHDQGFCRQFSCSKHFEIVFDKYNDKHIHSYRKTLAYQRKVQVQHLKDCHSKVVQPLLSELEAIPLRDKVKHEELANKISIIKRNQKKELTALKKKLKKTEKDDFEERMRDRNCAMETYRRCLAQKDDILSLDLAEVR